MKRNLVVFKIDSKSLLSFRLSTDSDNDGIYDSHIEHVIELKKGEIVEVNIK